MKSNKIPKSLYRIMPLYELIQMCDEPRKFVLKSPRLWEDTYEGFFYKRLLTEDGLKTAYDFIIKNVNEKNSGFTAKGKNIKFSLNLLSKEEKTLFIILKCIIQYYLTFSTCFSKDENESDAMWRIYSFDKTSIRVEFDREKLSNLEHIHFSPVYYDDNLNFLNLLEKTIKVNDGDIILKTFEPFIQKRKAFSHEKEIRMFYKHQLEEIFIFNIEKHPGHSNEDFNELYKDLKDCFINKKEFLPSKFLFAIQKYLYKFEKEDPTVQIILADEKIAINELIKSILIHPQAPDFYVKIIKKYCKKFKIEFVDKSSLYNSEK